MPAPIEIQVKKSRTFTRHYEFWQQEQLAAVLSYEKKFFCRSAVIKIKDNQWKIRTGGFWKKYIELTAEQSPYTKSHINFCWNYKLTFSPESRQTWYFKPAGFWKRTWLWHDDNEKPVIEIKSNQLSKKNRGRIILHLPESKEQYLLMVLGWFQLMTYEEHSAAVAASA